jgi:predicted CoA-binding protein
MRKTVIVGASPNPSRYSYLAAESLIEHGHEIALIGIKKGNVFGNLILNIREKPKISDVETITLYIGPQHQSEWYDYLISLKPSRIIFNPGTENKIFEDLVREAGIEVIEACTLVMLRTGQYATESKI